MKVARRNYEPLQKKWANTRLRASSTALDAWPYTDNFNDAVVAFRKHFDLSVSDSDFWQLLLAARKEGLGRSGNSGPHATSAPAVDNRTSDALRRLLPKSRGEVDRLPYSPSFDAIAARFRSETKSTLSNAELWRVALRIAKAAILASARPLFEKAICNFRRAIFEFNTDGDGRADGVLIFLHLAMEMLLKAVFLQRGTKISDPANKFHTISFNTCVEWALTNDPVRCIEFDGAQILRLLNNFRGGAYHFIVELDEAELYIVSRATADIFSKICEDVFQQSLAELVPARVLPISTIPLTDSLILLDRKRDQIQQLLRRGERLRALAASRSIAMIDAAARGESNLDISEDALSNLTDRIRRATDLTASLPNVAAMRIVAPNGGAEFALSLKGKSGTPVLGMQTPIDQPVVAYKTLDPRNQFGLTHNGLAERLSINTSNLTALIRELKLKDRTDCCYLHGPATAGGAPTPGYGAKAIEVAQVFLKNFDGDWRTLRNKHLPRRRL